MLQSWEQGLLSTPLSVLAERGRQGLQAGKESLGLLYQNEGFQPPAPNPNIGTPCRYCSVLLFLTLSQLMLLLALAPGGAAGSIPKVCGGNGASQCPSVP